MPGSGSAPRRSTADRRHEPENFMSNLPHVHPTVVHMLAEAARQVPEREALVCQGERLSYAQYLRCVAWFADELLALGARDKRVGIVLGNSLDICIAMFAIHAAGAQAVPCNPLYTGASCATSSPMPISMC
jgi:long-chain acyl-CoA synthetase